MKVCGQINMPSKSKGTFITRDPQRKTIVALLRKIGHVLVASLWHCISMATDNNLQAINIYHVVIPGLSTIPCSSHC